MAGRAPRVGGSHSPVTGASCSSSLLWEAKHMMADGQDSALHLKRGLPPGPGSLGKQPSRSEASPPPPPCCSRRPRTVSYLTNELLRA